MTSSRFRLFNIVSWSQSARGRTSSSSSSSSTTSSPTPPSSSSLSRNSNVHANVHADTDATTRTSSNTDATATADATSTANTANTTSRRSSSSNNNKKKKTRKSSSFRFKPYSSNHNQASNKSNTEDNNNNSNSNSNNEGDDNDAQPESESRRNAMDAMNAMNAMSTSININITEAAESADSVPPSNRQRSSTYPSRTRPRPSLATSSSSASSSPTSPPRCRSRTNSSSKSKSNSSSLTNTTRTRRRSPSPPPKIRTRLNSREIPRTYSGLYGIGGGHELTHQTQTPSSDLLPFELSRNYNTNWLYSYPSADLHHNNTNYLRNNIMSSSLLWIYIFFIVFVQFALLVLPIPILKHHVNLSFTITNIMHGVITIIFLHWLKGSPNFYDYGELNALTLWEQLSCSPESNQLANQTKQVLYVIPTILCYVSCRMVDFELLVSSVNLSVWGICIVAKMEGMHGVRLFGLNRTIGIDDDVRKSK